jgi:hypothetical protein
MKKSLLIKGLKLHCNKIENLMGLKTYGFAGFLNPTVSPFKNGDYYFNFFQGIKKIPPPCPEAG